MQLLWQLLCWDSSKRLTAEQALNSRFFKVGYLTSACPAKPSSLIVQGQQSSENQERSCESLSFCFQYNTNLPRPTLSPQLSAQQAKESLESHAEDSSLGKEMEQHNSLVHKHKRVQSAPISRLEASTATLQNAQIPTSNPTPTPASNPTPTPTSNPNSPSNPTPPSKPISPRSPSVLSETDVCQTNPARAVETPECVPSKIYMAEDFRTPPSVKMRSALNDGRLSNPPLFTFSPKLPRSIQISPRTPIVHPPLFEDVYASTPSPDSLLSPQPIPLSYKEYFPLGFRTASIFSPLAARSGVDNTVGPIRKGRIKEKNLSAILLSSPLSRPSFNPTLSHFHVC